MWPVTHTFVHGRALKTAPAGIPRRCVRGKDTAIILIGSAFLAVETKLFEHIRLYRGKRVEVVSKCGKETF